MKAGNYWFADIDDPDLAKILEAYDLEIPKSYIQNGELRRLKNRSRHSKYVYVRYIILSKSSEMLMNTTFLEDSFLIKWQSRGGLHF